MTYDVDESRQPSALAKESRLTAWLRDRRSIAIGYSGGVDSAYLAAVAVATLGAAQVLAIIGRSASYPESQWSAALGVAARIGLNVLEVDTDELSDPRYAANPANRCYFCKTELWSKLVPIARARGIATVADGTNAYDL
jgi:pyridinium-3,5-biscarboxylic acid mononucleotide sulfurtransferase